MLPVIFFAVTKFDATKSLRIEKLITNHVCGYHKILAYSLQLTTRYGIIKEDNTILRHTEKKGDGGKKS